MLGCGPESAMLNKLAIVVVLFGIAKFAMAQDPAGDAQLLVREMVATELRAQKEDQSRWTYISRKDEAGNQEVRRFVDTSKGPLSVIIARNGKPLNASQAKAEGQRIQELAHDPAGQQKE